ncbi:MAG: hypothetical protein KC657_31720 [Myxococcales bacterium]|nr:hypothetical protein [Myxococcales bacterium]
MADTWYASGSRLKIRYLEGADGSKQFSAWFDTARNDECTFARHADGSVRCLPLTNPPAANAQTYFDSSACTSRLALAQRTPTSPKYGVAYDPVGARMFHVIGGLHSGAVWSKNGANCTDTSTLKATYDFYPVGAEVEAAEFVGATARTEP